MHATPHVVLVGGGHAHVQTLARFAGGGGPRCRVSVVVDEPTSVYSGMVPGFVAGQYRLPELEIDVASLSRAANARIIIGRAVTLHADRQQIVLANGSRVSYDIASFDIGATVRGLDLPGVREHALPVRPIRDFTLQISKLLDRPHEHPPTRPFTVVVVGGGAAGVELAFAAESRIPVYGRGSKQVVLIEAGGHILPGLPRSLARRAHRKAARRGIRVRLNTPVTAVFPDAVELGGQERIPCDGLVWAAGPTSQAIFRDSGVATDERGYVRVRSTLQFEQHDNVFAAGDCATLINHPHAPKAGVYAVRQGPVLTHNLRAVTEATPLETFAPQRDFLTLLNAGDGTALGSKWGVAAEGRWVMRLKDWIDRRWVRQFSLSATRS